MMPTTDVATLFRQNREWSAARRQADPEFFSRLVAQQLPKYLWIGCADSRVPANEIIGLPPGEVFVHRNIANLVPHTDFNCLSVLQYAVDVLAVEHIFIVGHYGCGGVHAAYHNDDNGLIDHWLRHIKDIVHHHRLALQACATEEARINRLCELNVMSQVQNAAGTSIVQNAWRRGQSLTVHGWVYDLHDGLLRDLECSVAGLQQIEEAYRLKQGDRLA
jgi:carbonic anhydrase